MGELERKQRVWCLRVRCLLAQLDFQDFVDGVEVGAQGADPAEVENRLRFLDVFTREFEAKRVKYLEAAKKHPQVVAASELGRTNDVVANLTQGNIAMIRMRTQARELHRKYSQWRSNNAKTESKLAASTSSPRKHSKVKRQSKDSTAATSGPPSRITSTFAELQPSLPSAQFPIKPQQRRYVADSKISSPKKLLSPQKHAAHSQRHSSTSIILDKTHVMRSQSMSPSVRSNVTVMRAYVHSPHRQQSRALSPNTLKRVSWVPPNYAPPPKILPLSRPSQAFDSADAQKRMHRINRALSSSVLKQKPQRKSLNSRKSSVSPTRGSGFIDTKTKASRNSHDIVFPDLPFSISSGNTPPNRPLMSVKLKSPTNAHEESTAPASCAPRMTATFSHQPRKSLARKLRLESVSPTFHSSRRTSSRSNRSWLSRSVSAPRVRVTCRKRSSAKSKVPSRTRRRSKRAIGARTGRGRCRSRSKSRTEASGSRNAMQNFISISRAEINGDTLTLKPGALLFYGRLVFEFHAPLRSPQFHMLSEPEAAAWHVFNLWRDNLSRGVKEVPRFAYIHAYRVTSDAKFAVRSACEMAPDECDENFVTQDSVSRCTAWDKSIRSLDALRRYFRGQSIDFARSRTKCHINSHRSMLHHTPRPRPCCKLFFRESQRKNRCVELELTRVYEVDIVEWLERMLEEPCALNRARILPLLRHPFKMRRQAAACSPLKDTAQAAVDVLSHMFRE